MTTENILVIGGTGKTGSRVAQQLKEKDGVYLASDTGAEFCIIPQQKYVDLSKLANLSKSIKNECFNNRNKNQQYLEINCRKTTNFS